jgi:hypothetical protein
VVAPCFWGKLAAFLDEVAELGLAALELARFVAGGYPVGDFVCLLFVSFYSILPHIRIARYVPSLRSFLKKVCLFVSMICRD